jgi:hypothetical protein
MTKALLISFVMAVVLLVACEDMNGPGRLELVELIGPNDTLGQATMKVAAVQVIPPKEYRRWYREVSKCLGMPGSFDAITWYAVPLPWRGRTGFYVGQHSGDDPGQGHHLDAPSRGLHGGEARVGASPPRVTGARQGEPRAR